MESFDLGQSYLINNESNQVADTSIGQIGKSLSSHKKEFQHFLQISKSLQIFVNTQPFKSSKSKFDGNLSRNILF